MEHDHILQYLVICLTYDYNYIVNYLSSTSSMLISMLWDFHYDSSKENVTFKCIINTIRGTWLMKI